MVEDFGFSCASGRCDGGHEDQLHIEIKFGFKIRYFLFEKHVFNGLLKVIGIQNVFI